MALSSSQVRTGDSQSSNRGSNPRSATNIIIQAPIAQLERASDYGSEGWGFKSSWAHLYYLQIYLWMKIIPSSIIL